MPTAPTTYETAQTRVEAGDLSFEAIGALTIAHGEKLAAERPMAEAIGPDHIRIYYADGGHAGVSVEQAERIAQMRAGQGHIAFASAIRAAIARLAAEG